MSNKDLKPGSDHAIKAGCTCPSLDNKKGEGIYIDKKVCFWINIDCPVHSLDENDYEKK